MEGRSIYEQIGLRTDGNVYLGVVGPVRTGKSTFIKRFMEQLVLPNIEDVYRRERAKDELPQSSSGKTIMTSEPKFVPEEAVAISPDGKTKLSVRLIDSVGYMVDGALGAEEDGIPRMVTTPWADHEIPMTEAAELGTKKVMEEHSSIGMLITTDGTVTDIPREDYVKAEQRAIEDMQATGKPFIVLVNSSQPHADAAKTLCDEIRTKYAVSCMAVNCLTMGLPQIQEILACLLKEFPVSEVWYYLPGWVTALAQEHAVKTALFDAMLQCTEGVSRLTEAESAARTLCRLDEVESVSRCEMDLGTGILHCTLAFPEELFYKVLSDESGFEVKDDADLMRLLESLRDVKREYDKVASAIEQVNETGYGIVMPSLEQMHLEVPKIIKKNGNYAVQLRASAPSIHMMRADIETELSPMVGDEQQSEDLVAYLLGEYEGNTEKLWESNIFGKSLYDLVTEGLTTKLRRMPDDARAKLQTTLTRIINENTAGLICLLL